MRRWLFAIPLVLSGVNLLFAGCGSNDNGSAPSAAPIAADDASVGVPPTLPPGDAVAGPVAEAAPPTASFRVAHLSPDLPAFDVCVLARGSTAYQGPLIGQLSGLEAGAPGITFSQVSADTFGAGGIAPDVAVTCPPGTGGPRRGPQ